MTTRFGVLVIGTLMFVATGCGGGSDKAQGPPKDVPLAALERLLPNTDAINSLMGTTGMVAHPPTDQMGDHRNLLPNLNCLGVWQIDEAAIYDKGWTGMRQQLFRAPDTDGWDNLVVQSAVLFPSGDDAKAFFDQSADRWSKCTNHHVNIQLNGQPLPRWTSGDLARTDADLTIPFTRVAGDQTRACQRALGVAANLIVDVQACKPGGSTVTQASDIVQKVKDAMPR